MQDTFLLILALKQLLYFYIMCQSDFYPEVRGRPLVLGHDAKRPSTNAYILAQELNKFDSSDQATTTVQNSWYCTIIRSKYQQCMIDGSTHVSIIWDRLLCDSHVSIGGGLLAAMGTLNGGPAWVFTIM